jgi:hypothetical protein
MMCFANARLILRASEQPQPLRTLQRSERQQRPQWPADRIRCRPFRRRHGLLAIPIAGMRREAAPRPAAARVGAVAPIAEQIALRLRHIGVALCIDSTLHCLRVIRRGNRQSRAVTFRRIVCSFAAPIVFHDSRWVRRFPLPFTSLCGRRVPGEQMSDAGKRAAMPAHAARLRGCATRKRRGKKETVLAAHRLRPRLVHHAATSISYEALPPTNEGSGAPKGALSDQCPRQARPRAALWRRAAFRRSRLRHSPPASTPMARLQNRVSRGFDWRGFCPLRQTAAVKHAPCGPVLVPVDRGSEAARVRSGILRPRAPRLALVFAACLPERRPQLSEIRCLYLNWRQVSMKKRQFPQLRAFAKRSTDTTGKLGQPLSFVANYVSRIAKGC